MIGPKLVRKITRSCFVCGAMGLLLSVSIFWAYGVITYFSPRAPLRHMPITCHANEHTKLRAWAHLPITMEIDPSVPTDAKQAIIYAAQRWERSAGNIRMFNFVEPTSSRAPARDGISRIYWVTRDWRHQRNYEALAEWYVNKPPLVEVDIYINAQFYRMSYGLPSAVQGHVDLETLMLHELGHVLGLGHIPETVLDADVPVGVARRSLGATEISEVACRYAHKHPTFTSICSGASIRRSSRIVNR